MVSICCIASVDIEGKETKYYVCLECGHACDTIEIE